MAILKICQKATMQHYKLNIPATNTPQTTNILTERQTAEFNKEMQDAALAHLKLKEKERYDELRVGK